MTKLQLLHRALNERLMAAVEQIMEMVGGTVREYEVETVRARTENEALRRRLRWMEENHTDCPDIEIDTSGSGQPVIGLDEPVRSAPSIKIEPINVSDLQSLIPDASLAAAVSIRSADLEVVHPGATEAAHSGPPDSTAWDSSLSYMAPLDSDPTAVKQRRVRSRSKRASYACPDCGKVFGREQTLLFHMRVHSSDRPYACRRREACFYGDKKRKKKLQVCTLEDEDVSDQPDTSNEPRLVELTNSDLDELEMQRNEVNTVRQTSWALSVFTSWLKSNAVEVDFSVISKNEMNDVLRRFYGSVRNVKGEFYSISSFIGLRAGLNRYLNESPISRGWCLMKDAEFKPANNVFVGVVKKIRKNGGDRTLHHPAISSEDLAKIYQSKALDPGTPRGLLNKVWFDIQLHFGRRGKEGNRELRRESFVIQEYEKGEKFVTLSFNEETKNHKTHQERDRELRRGAMFQCAGEMCPVASLELYLSKLPVDAPAFYLQPKKSVHLSDAVWYSTAPLGVNQLSKMLPRICEEASTSRVYTNHCLHATAIQSLSDAGMEAREIMTVSGHKSEMALKTYWRPSLQSRKRWSNVLSLACNPTEDLEQPPVKTPKAQRTSPLD